MKENKTLERTLLVEKHNFIPFYFDGNLLFGHISNLGNLEQLFSYYSYSELKKAKSRGGTKLNKRHFGFGSKFKGQTFEEWVEKNNLKHYFIGNINPRKNFWTKKK